MRNKNSFAAIHISAQHGTSKVADLLVKAKADLNLSYNENDDSTVDMAINSGHREIFEEVLRKNGKKIVDESRIEDDLEELITAVKNGKVF